MLPEINNMYIFVPVLSNQRKKMKSVNKWLSMTSAKKGTNIQKQKKTKNGHANKTEVYFLNPPIS